MMTRKINWTNTPAFFLSSALGKFCFEKATSPHSPSPTGRGGKKLVTFWHFLRRQVYKALNNIKAIALI